MPFQRLQRADRSGAFEVAALEGNKVLKQAGVGFPVKWLRDDVRPVTQLGAQNWYATNLSAMILAPPGQGAYIAVHIAEENGNTNWPGCFLGIEEAGRLTDRRQDGTKWWIGSQLSALGTNSSASGMLPPRHGAAPEAGWRQLELRVAKGGTMAALIDGEVVHTGTCSIAAGTLPGMTSDCVRH